MRIDLITCLQVYPEWIYMRLGTHNPGYIKNIYTYLSLNKRLKLIRGR